MIMTMSCVMIIYDRVDDDFNSILCVTKPKYYVLILILMEHKLRELSYFNSLGISVYAVGKFSSEQRPKETNEPKRVVLVLYIRTH